MKFLAIIGIFVLGFIILTDKKPVAYRVGPGINVRDFQVEQKLLIAHIRAEANSSNMDLQTYCESVEIQKYFGLIQNSNLNSNDVFNDISLKTKYYKKD